MNRILIIDDELDICLMLSRYLKALTFEVEYANTLEQAFLKIKYHHYTLMLIDLNLVEGSGYDIINYVRSNGLNTQIIVISAHDSEEIKSLEMGADLFIAKPFTLQRINYSLKMLNILPAS